MRVEKDFDAHEWLEGAKDAFWGGEGRGSSCYTLLSGFMGHEK
jgi:hypothetical protein